MIKELFNCDYTGRMPADARREQILQTAVTLGVCYLFFDLDLSRAAATESSNSLIPSTLAVARAGAVEKAEQPFGSG